MTKPRTATGRKVVAIHGSALLDDVLGIEAEASAAPDREGLIALNRSMTQLITLDWTTGEYRAAIRSWTTSLRAILAALSASKDKER